MYAQGISGPQGVFTLCPTVNLPWSGWTTGAHLIPYCTRLGSFSVQLKVLSWAPALGLTESEMCCCLRQ